MTSTTRVKLKLQSAKNRLFAGFHGHEARIIFGTSGVYASRMLGVYMATPVLSPYTASLPGSTDIWIGLSLGAYGLTQAIFQIPFGILGDRWGRLRSLLLGLAVFAVGSFICARAETAPLLVLGRAVQGVGAMASTIIALFGDRTREEIRTRAMAGMGLILGLAFASGLVFGPLLSSKFGVPPLFDLATGMSILGLFALPLILRGNSNYVTKRREPNLSVRRAFIILSKQQLLGLDIGIMILHLGLTAIFVVLPLRLAQIVPASQQWQVYAPVLTLGFAALGISSHFAERPRGAKFVLAIGSLLVAAGFVVMATTEGLYSLVGALALYIAGFASIEPALAAQVTRHSHTLVRGTAAGVFNTVQFSGVFFGGLLAGAALNKAESVLFLCIAAAQLCWLFWAWRIPKEKLS